MSKELEMLKEVVKMIEEREGKEAVQPDISAGIKLANLQCGETFDLCDHEFIVLKQDGDKTHIVCKDFWVENERFGDSTDYKDSNIKRIMEESVLPEIEKAVGAENIVEHVVDLTSVDMQTDRGTLLCKVRPITFDEAREYNELIVNKDLDDWWWTCTPWSTAARDWPYSVAVVSPSGYFNFRSYDYGLGVRPFCILKSNIFVSKKGA